jgi:hypothetical protein
MSRHPITTRPYVSSHQKAPRGRGSWAFQPAEAYHPGGAEIADLTIFSPSMTYTEAKRWLVANHPAGSYDLLP